MGNFETTIPLSLNFDLFTIIYFGDVDIFSIIDSIPQNIPQNYQEDGGFSFLLEPLIYRRGWKKTGVWELYYNKQEGKIENLWFGPIYGGY